MSKLLPMLTFGLCLASAGALAQDGRFALKDAEDGFIKLDTKTGTVTHCRKSGADWTCGVLDEEGGVE